jgi:mono/diheme cytochrome c family protein
LTPEDVARGRELFLGHRPLANGGSACVACHTVNDGEARDGGRLGPELTKSYERLGGRSALGARLWAHDTRTMQPAYQRHNLEPDEVLALVAYLEDADRQAPADTSRVPLKFVLVSLGGAVLGLLMVSALWGSRSRRERAAPGGPAASRPADFVGAGL